MTVKNTVRIHPENTKHSRFFIRGKLIQELVAQVIAEKPYWTETGQILTSPGSLYDTIRAGGR